MLGPVRFVIFIIIKHDSARTQGGVHVWEAASKAVSYEEAMKQKLCEDLNNLVGIMLNACLLICVIIGCLI